MPINVTEEWQKVLLNLSEPNTFDPPYLRQYFVNNIVQRVLSVLFAIDKDTGEIRKLKCMPDGSLLVSSTAIGFSNNRTFSGTAGDTETELDFDTNVARIDIWVYDYDMKIARSSDGITYQDWITIKANTFYSFDASTRKLKVINATAGQNANYQIVGWW